MVHKTQEEIEDELIARIDDAMEYLRFEDSKRFFYELGQIHALIDFYDGDISTWSKALYVFEEGTNVFKVDCKYL